MSYQSSIRDDRSSNCDDDSDFEVDIDLTMVKRVDCKTREIRDIYVGKLHRLKLDSEMFNRVKIPKFTYSIHGIIVLLTTEFIKGSFLKSSIDKNIVYEDIVQCQSDWTFSDFGAENFIVEEGTGVIFSVDFQSYRYYPNRRARETSWLTQTQLID